VRQRAVPKNIAITIAAIFLAAREQVHDPRRRLGEISAMNQ
jgi:hypothetical protein